MHRKPALFFDSIPSGLSLWMKACWGIDGSALRPVANPSAHLPIINQYSIMRLITAILSLSIGVHAASGDDAIAFSPQADVYPHGLYPGRQARTLQPSEGGRIPRDAGGYDVLTGLQNVTGLRTDAVEGKASEAAYEFHNLRVASGQTTFDDYLIGYYSFDLASQRLAPVRFERAPEVGPYEPTEKFLLKDNPAPINFYLNQNSPNQFAQGTQHSFQSDTDYFANLTTAQRLCLVMTGYPANQLLRFVVTKQDGTTFLDVRVNTAQFSSVVWKDMPVLVSGTYRLRVDAVSPTRAFSFNARFYNENGWNTTSVTSGNALSASLGGSANGLGLPYRKFKVSLAPGQTINIPGDNDTDHYLINSRGAIVGGGGNGGFNVTVTSEDDYYIVIVPRDALNGGTESYSGTVTITDGLGFQDWSWSHGLAYGRDGAAHDADGDGLNNLLEYALGLNPAKRDEREAVEMALTPTHLKLAYRRPNYLQGVTVRPRFSADMRNWTVGTAAVTGSVPGASLMEASIPRAGGPGFGHLEVVLEP